MIPTFLRPFLAAILAPLLLSIAGRAAAHGITITDTQVHDAVDYLVTWVIPIMAGLSVVIRRVIDKWANPANTASAGLATAGKQEARAMKVAEVTAERNAAFGEASSLEEPVPDLAKIPASERGR